MADNSGELEYHYTGDQLPSERRRTIARLGKAATYGLRIAMAGLQAGVAVTSLVHAFYTTTPETTVGTAGGGTTQSSTEGSTGASNSNDSTGNVTVTNNTTSNVDVANPNSLPQLPNTAG